jgi:hypothetical protein
METTRTAAVRTGEPPNKDGLAGGSQWSDFSARYTVCRRCNEVRIGGLGRGHLAEGGRLVLTLSKGQPSLPRGTAIMLSRAVPRDVK